MSMTQATVAKTGVMKTIVAPLIAYSLIYALLFFVPNMLPLYTGIFIDVGGMGQAEAGGVNSTYLGATALAAIAATILLSKIPLRRFGVVAVLLQVVGFGIPLVFSSVEAIYVGMAIAGLGNGALFAVTNASAAVEKYPILIFGAGMVLANVVSAAVPTPMYAAVELLGMAGAFATPLALMPLILVSLLVLPRRTAPPVSTAVGANDTKRTSLGAMSTMFLVAIVLTQLFTVVYYAYSERVLVQAGFDFDAIGLIFTVVYLVAAVAGVIAMVMARWPGQQMLSLIIVTALLVASVVFTTNVTGHIAVVIGVLAASLTSMLSMAIQPAVAAQIEPTGRLSAATSGAMLASMALGPFLGGWILETFGFAGISNLAILLGAISIGLLFVILTPQKS